MSGRGDDGGYEPHPGDPWHPAWTSDQEESEIEIEGFEPYEDSPPDDGKGRKKKRRGRKKKRQADDELPSDSAEEPAEPDPGGADDTLPATMEPIAEPDAEPSDGDFDDLFVPAAGLEEDGGIALEPETELPDGEADPIAAALSAVEEPETVPLAAPREGIEEDEGEEPAASDRPDPLGGIDLQGDDDPDDGSVELEEDAVVPEAGDDGDSSEADSEPPAGELPPVEPIRHPSNDPQPAWLSDKGEGELDESATLPVSPPAWVGDSTVGADEVAAGFERVEQAPPVLEEELAAEDPEDEEPEPVGDGAFGDGEPATGEPAEDDMEDAALAALAALDVGESEDEGEEPGALDEGLLDLGVPLEGGLGLAGPDAGPEVAEDDTVEAEPILEVAHDGPEEASDEVVSEVDPVTPAAADEESVAGLGVAGAEAFDALQEADPDEEVERWQEFADDPVVPEEPPRRRRRGIWPFRRRPREEPVAEEATEWQGEASEVPRSWFAEVDEDEVVPPDHHLPETEWPADDPAAALHDGQSETALEPGLEPEPMAHAGGELQPAEGLDDGGLFEPREDPAVDPEQPADSGEDTGEWGEPVVLDAIPALDPTDEAWDEPASDPVEADPVGAGDPVAGGWSSEPAGYEPDLGVGEPGTAGTGLPDPDEDPVLPEEPLTLSFDDGTGRPAEVSEEFERPQVAEPVDEWVTGPVEIDPDSTEELAEPPAVPDVTEDIYSTAVTTEHRDLAEEIHRRGDEETAWTPLSAAMPGVETGVVGFEDVADLETEDEYREPERSNLGARVLTGVVLVGLLLGSLLVGGEAFAGFIGLIAIVGLGELYATLRRVGFEPLSLLGYAGGIALLVTTWFHGPVAIAVAILLTAVAALFVFAFSPLRQDALVNAGLTVLGVAWVPATVAFAIPILRQEQFRPLVLAIVAGTVAMDVGAYGFGKTWGRRALAPVLSPNKSVEGLVGGVVLAIGAGLAFGAFVEPFDLRLGAVLGLVIAFAAPLGDLAESMVKRSLGVKDMGSILPGHGGILDRVDAFLFVLPAAWIVYRVAGLLG